MPETGPITIILDSEHDYALKNALATALGGPTGKTFELGQNQKICKIDIFRLLHALDACKWAYNHYFGF